MKQIKLYNKKFILYYSHKEIQKVIKKLSLLVYNYFHKDDIPIFVGVLNGVIMFMSDFLKYYPGKCEIAFIKLTSYDGLYNTESVKDKLQITNNIHNRHVVVLEDIIETGNTLEFLYNYFKKNIVKSFKIISLFFKPNKFTKKLYIDLIGINLDNEFVVGYGLDYNGLGRNYENLYQLKL